MPKKAKKNKTNSILFFLSCKVSYFPARDVASRNVATGNVSPGRVDAWRVYARNIVHARAHTDAAAGDALSASDHVAH